MPGKLRELIYSLNANHDPAVIAQVRALMEQSAKAERALAKSNAALAEQDFKIAALALELAYYRRANARDGGDVTKSVIADDRNALELRRCRQPQLHAELIAKTMPGRSADIHYFFK